MKKLVCFGVVCCLCCVSLSIKSMDPDDGHSRTSAECRMRPASFQAAEEARRAPKALERAEHEEQVRLEQEERARESAEREKKRAASLSKEEQEISAACKALGLSPAFFQAAEEARRAPEAPKRAEHEEQVRREQAKRARESAEREKKRAASLSKEDQETSAAFKAFVGEYMKGRMKLSHLALNILWLQRKIQDDTQRETMSNIGNILYTISMAHGRRSDDPDHSRRSDTADILGNPDDSRAHLESLAEKYGQSELAAKIKQIYKL